MDAQPATHHVGSVHSTAGAPGNQRRPSTVLPDTIMEPTDHDALDAYSQIVSAVAEALLPRVAAVRVRRTGRSGEGSGSAVVLTAEGHLLTNAHVVGNADTGEATFADGSVAA